MHHISGGPLHSLPKGFIEAIAPNYRLDREIGRGGMAVVYLAEDLKHHRDVAVKIQGLGTELDHARFVREIEVVARLSHPHILPLFDSGNVDGHAYFVMPYIRGESLEARLNSTKKLPVNEALRLAREVASALGHAHQQGLVHRDIKPSNILLSDGMALVADFGLARPVHPTESRNLTSLGAILGTPRYIAPEQVQCGDDVDGRADLYSLGCVLYEMLVGQPPFKGPTIENVIFQHLTVAPRPVSDFRPEVPEGIARAISKVLSKSPADRFATAAHFVAALLTTDAETAAAAPEQAVEPATSEDRLVDQRTVSLPFQHLQNMLTSFVGRESELASVRTLLTQNRLVTLTGPGGAGKTRLALHFAQSMMGEFEHSAWVVDLAPVSDPLRVASAVAATLRLRELPNQSIEETLQAFLRPRNLLMILDSCEHLVLECSRLAEALLRTCPGLKILATSREALASEGEVVWPVPPLSLPDGTDDPSVDSISSSDAVRLFVERAAIARPGYHLTEDNAPQVARICRRLDGIPLALELVASRVRVLSLDQILSRLDSLFALVAPGPRSALLRHRTLHAAIEWSHLLLEPEERILFRRMAVFPSEWSLRAVEDVCAGEGILATEVLSLLARLVDKSMVVAIPGQPRTLGQRGDGAGGEFRYRLLETIRQYAADKLAESDEVRSLRVSHRNWYLAFAESAEPELSGSQQPEWLDRLEAEHNNFRAALKSAQTDPSAEGTALLGRLSAGLATFWRLRGHMTEGRAWLDAALSRREGIPRDCLARTLLGAGGIAHLQADYSAAQRYLEESRDLFLDSDDKSAAAQSLTLLGAVSGIQGHFEQARAQHQMALTLQRDLGNKRGVIQAANNLGTTEIELGEYTQARALFVEAVSCARELGDKVYTGVALGNLAYLACIQGDSNRALESAEESLRLYRELDVKSGIAASLIILAKAALGAGDAERAWNHLEESVFLAHQLGNKHLVANAHMFQSDVMLHRRSLERAFELNAEALRIFREIGAWNDVYDCLHRMARRATAIDQPAMAARLYGAVDAQRTRGGFAHPIVPADAPAYEEDLKSLRNSLGPGAFAAAWSDGRSMTPEVAADAALRSAGDRATPQSN